MNEPSPTELQQSLYLGFPYGVSSAVTHLCFAVLWFYGHTHSTLSSPIPNQHLSMDEEYHVLDYSYPSSFISRNNELFARLRPFSGGVLLGYVRNFQSTISKRDRTKAGYTGPIKSDFIQRTHILIQLSTAELVRYVSKPVS